MNPKIVEFEKSFAKTEFPAFKSGDTIKVSTKVKEGEKERLQVFEGTVIRYKKGGNRSTVTLRKISFGVGVERVFQLHSPYISKIDLVTSGRVRRSRLYYLRGLEGKKARVQVKEEHITTAA